MATISFADLWANYPSSDPCVDSRTNRPPPGFENQCAIRLGAALKASKVSFQSFHGSVCPVPKSDPSLAASAQQLANWLKKQPFDGCGATERWTGQTVFTSISERTGIIFLADYWQRPGEKGTKRTGDHIDLWNGSRMIGLMSWIRVQLNFSIDGIWSDYRLAQSSWFWPVK